MSRTYPPRPIIAVGGLLFRDDSLLLVKRAKEPGFGRWSIPGGAVKVGETLTQGLAREMAEEIGLSVEVGPLVEIIERIFHDPEGKVQYHYVILDYLCYAREGQPCPGSDASEVRFVPPAQWPDYILDSASLKILDKALAMVSET
ncbi:MAG: NUDIX hydrolase [Deltaproteobacteria bacterium]|nr:NUDIX hydrolase [Deltaproteobacteria bacterium]MBW2051274.1 NUDIX hydrolase [Deltaproteobacteria bacterium]MBW2139916.1 NUDIX hydrolase [Deltaproteobacteria bacterium]MBW2322381.1 NUDIX hydrolase [Deltaproteobacteria bacterium]